MKKLLISILTVGAALTLSGCSTKESTANKIEVTEEVSFAGGKIPFAIFRKADAGLEDALEYKIVSNGIYYTKANYRKAGGVGSFSVWRQEAGMEAEEIACFPYPEQYLISFAVDKEGSLYYLLCDETDDYVISLQKDTAEGKTQFCTRTEITREADTEDEQKRIAGRWYTITDNAVSPNGEVCFYNKERVLFLFDESGCLNGTKEIGDGENVREGGIVAVGTGDLYIYGIHKEAQSNLTIRFQSMDVKQGELSMPVTVSIPENSSYISAAGGYGEDILLSTRESVWRYLPSEGKLSKYLTWTAPTINLTGDTVKGLGIPGEGEVFVLAENTEMQVLWEVMIEGRLEEEIPVKRELTLGILDNMNKDRITDAINEFNISNSDFRIEGKEYDRNAEELYRELLLGKGPDLLELSSLPIDVLAAKGILEELTPFLESSREVEKEDLLPRIVESGTIGGRLLFLMPDFSVRGLVAGEGITHNNGWTPEEFLEQSQAFPDASMMSGRQNPVYFLLDYVMAADMHSYIDFQKKECYFDNPHFCNLLELIKLAQVDKEAEEEEYGTLKGFFKQEYLVGNITISYLMDYADARAALSGKGEIAGYPNKEGKPRFQIMSFKLFGINSASSCKDGAWAFMEYLLSEEYQNRENSFMGTFPVRKDSFDTFVSAYTQEEAIYQNSCTGEWMESTRMLTEEDKSFLSFLVDNAYLDKTLAGLNGFDYRTIIFEEASAFFAGDKTSEETARMIQNRVTLYLKE